MKSKLIWVTTVISRVFNTKNVEQFFSWNRRWKDFTKKLEKGLRLLAAKFNKAQKNKVNIGYRITNPFSCSTSTACSKTLLSQSSQEWCCDTPTLVKKLAHNTCIVWKSLEKVSFYNIASEASYFHLQTKDFHVRNQQFRTFFKTVQKYRQIEGIKTFTDFCDKSGTMRHFVNFQSVYIY